MASVLSLASIASCDSAPIASTVLAIGPTDRALDRRGSSPAAAETLAPGDVAFGRCEPASASLSFHFVTSRAFLLADDPRRGAVPGEGPDLGTVVGVGSLTPAELDPFTPEARRLLVEDAAFGLWRGVPVPVEESLSIATSWFLRPSASLGPRRSMRACPRPRFRCCSRSSPTCDQRPFLLWKRSSRGCARACPSGPAPETVLAPSRS